MPTFVAMAQRKEVFRSKVLQKLYPAAPQLQAEPNATPTASLPKTFIVKRTIPEIPSVVNASSPSQRIYTVLLPPADYKIDEDKSVTQSEFKIQNPTEDQAEKSGHGSSDETNQSKEPEENKRRKRKKRKHHLPDLNQTAVIEGKEHISKNKKRKLKKKRRKEKLLSMGLVPRAAAVEFTYQREELGQEGDEEGSCQVAKPAQFSGNP